MGKDKTRRSIHGHDYQLRERTTSKKEANDIADRVRDAGHRAVVLPVEEHTTGYGVFVDGMTNTPKIKRERREKRHLRKFEEHRVENAPSAVSRAARRLRRDTEERITARAGNPRTTPDEIARLKTWHVALGKYADAIDAGRKPMLSEFLPITGEPNDWEDYKQYVKELQKDAPKLKGSGGAIVGIVWDPEGGRH